LVTVLQFKVIGKSLFSFVLSLTCDMRKHQFQCSLCDIDSLLPFIDDCHFPVVNCWYLCEN
jgi:hypothetical protein